MTVQTVNGLNIGAAWRDFSAQAAVGNSNGGPTGLRLPQGVNVVSSWLFNNDDATFFPVGCTNPDEILVGSLSEGRFMRLGADPAKGVLDINHEYIIGPGYPSVAVLPNHNFAAALPTALYGWSSPAVHQMIPRSNGSYSILSQQHFAHFWGSHGMTTGFVAHPHHCGFFSKGEYWDRSDRRGIVEAYSIQINLTGINARSVGVWTLPAPVERLIVGPSGTHAARLTEKDAYFINLSKPPAPGVRGPHHFAKIIGIGPDAPLAFRGGRDIEVALINGSDLELYNLTILDTFAHPQRIAALPNIGSGLGCLASRAGSNHLVYSVDRRVVACEATSPQVKGGMGKIIPKYSIQGHNDTVVGLGFTRSGKTLAVTDQAGYVTVQETLWP